MKLMLQHFQLMFGHFQLKFRPHSQNHYLKCLDQFCPETNGSEEEGVVPLERPTIQSEDSEDEDAFNDEIPPLLNEPTHIGILSSDSENEAETSAENSQTLTEC